jgi:hypothetical protein
LEIKMARIRNIKPDFYSHEELNDLESSYPELKPMLVFSGLWNQCEFSGVFLWSPRKLKLAILPFVDFDISKSLELLEAHGFIKHFKNSGKEYGFVINFTKYQAISGSEKNNGLKYPPPDDKYSEYVTVQSNDVIVTKPVQSFDSQTTADLGLRTKDLGLRTLQNFSENPDPQPDPPVEKSSSTAIAVAPDIVSSPPGKALVIAKPPGRKKLELTAEQLPLFHAAKACFESSDKAKALIYQDKESTAREMRHLKTFVVRCSNMAAGEITAGFMKSVLEHFKAMTNGTLKGKAAFTPRSLITPWIWELVVDSLPENNVDEALRASIRGLFK